MEHSVLSKDRRAVAKLLRHYFINRDDAYTVMCDHPWQSRGNYYRRVFEPLTDDLVISHLEGKLTLGIFPTNIENQTCKFVCFDVDDTRPEYLTKALVMARRHGEPLIEASGTSGRYHVWLLLETDQSIVEIRKRFFPGAPWDGIDLFPNRNKVINDFFCELPIKLPLGFHRVANKWSHFVDEQLEYIPAIMALMS
jgi:hypothetical protein